MKTAYPDNYKVQYREHTIQIKRDFGEHGFLIDGIPCFWGYVVVKDGANPMPGATWFQTVSDAKTAIDVLISTGDNAAFWEVLRSIRQIERTALHDAIFGITGHGRADLLQA